VTKIIALFNHKGGVSKTTTTFHLGWQLIRLGKRVLMVDADPQCNLTGLTLGIEDYDSVKNNDIYRSLKDSFEKGTRITDGVETTKTRNDDLNILAGHIDFAKFDLQIATAITSSSRLPILKTFLGSMNDLIRKSGEKGNFDIILIDMSQAFLLQICVF
jgi:cellulose biosynthesis protein BcsQ